MLRDRRFEYGGNKKYDVKLLEEFNPGFCRRRRNIQRSSEILVVDGFAHALAQQLNEIRGAAPGTDPRKIAQILACHEFHPIIAQPRGFLRVEKGFGEAPGRQQTLHAGVKDKFWQE
jgi:hypothetical protein